MEAPDYGFYASHGFAGTERQFAASVERAKAVVDRIVGGNAVAESQEDAYRLAVCAAAEKLTELGDGTAASARVGSFSITQGGASSGREEAGRSAMDFLAPAGLAWAGV